MGKTLYKESMNAEMIALASTGKSMVQIAAEFGISKYTMEKWSKNPAMPEFMEAYSIARTCNEAYWEDVGQKGTKGMIKGFNPYSWHKIMAARHQDDWTERSAQKIELKNEVAQMTNEQIDEALKALLAARELNKAKSNGSSGAAASPGQV